MCPVPKSIVENISHEHQKIHDGLSFTVCLTDADIDIAVPTYYRISVPFNCEAHMEIDAALATAGLVELYESPTLTGNGTAQAPKNRNRGSTNAARTTVGLDATISAAGTLLGWARVPGANHPAFGVGGNAAQRHEFILAPGKTYLVKLSTDADNNKSWTTLSWYEDWL